MKFKWLYAGLMVAVLAGCGTSDDPKKAKRLCPQTAIVHELERVQDYGKDAIEPHNLVADARMQKVDGDCEYRDDGIDVNFTLTMAAQKGARLGGSQFGFSYFVSVVDPARKIIDKNLMTATFKFGSDKTDASLEEPLHVFIPLAKDALANDYQILMGFQLTEDQIEAQRKMGDAQVEKIIGR